MWSDFLFFIFSPWEPDLVLFCGRRWRDHSSIQCLQHALGSGLHQLPLYPRKSGCLVQWEIWFNPVLLCLPPLHFLSLHSTVSLKKALLMMVACTRDYCTVFVSCSSPPGRGPEGGQAVVKASAVTPQGPGAGRPRTKAERWMKTIIQEISVSLCEPQHVHMKTKGCAFPPTFFWKTK